MSLFIIFFIFSIASFSVLQQEIESYEVYLSNNPPDINKTGSPIRIASNG